MQVTKTPSSNKGDEYTVTFSDAEADGVLQGAQVHRVPVVDSHESWRNLTNDGGVMVDPPSW